MKSKITLLLAALVLLVSCGGRQESTVRTRTFPMVQVPSVYTTQEEVLDYLRQHYWDKFLSLENIWPGDSTHINGVTIEALEEVFANFVVLTENIDIESGKLAVAKLFDRVEAFQKADTSSYAFTAFAELAHKYYYDPNSPYRNEDLYLPYVSGLAASQFTPDNRRKSLSHDAGLCSLNPIGQPVADFRFVDIRGREHRLYDIKSEYILLFFSNPGCEACKEIIDVLSTSESVAALIGSGRLAVVNVYIDEDLDAWRSYQAIYPHNWYNGYDPDMIIRNDLLYSVRAIPSLYLLDGGKKLIMKDAVQDAVFAFLEQL